MRTAPCSVVTAGLRLGVAVLLVTVFLRDALPHPSYSPAFGDLLYFQFLWDSGRTIWTSYRQWPFWNPYHCGGMVELANVHSMAWSPFFLPALVFDAGTGIRIFIWTHLVIAFTGAWAWSRARGLVDPWALAPAIAFTMCGFFPARAAGHLSFLPFAWVPWLLLLYDRAETEARHAYLMGALVALCVYSGAPYPITFGLLLIAALVTRDLAALACRRACGMATPGSTRPLVIAALAAAGFLLVGAFKLFPSVEYMLTYPRAMPAGDDRLGLRALVEIFLYRPFTRERAGYTFPFDEYRDYVGPFVVAGALSTVVRGRACWRDLAIAGFFLSLVFGDHGPWSPYALLHQLPGFSSQRVPSRFAILLIPFLGLWFGRAVADLAGDRRGSLRSLAAGAILVATFGDLASINTVVLRDWFTEPPEMPPAAAEEPPGFLQNPEFGRDWRKTYLRAPIDGYGFVDCGTFEPNPIPRAAGLEMFTRTFVKGVSSRTGTGRLVRFTPNRVEIAVDFTGPGVVTVNQNYYPGWTSDVGSPTRSGGQTRLELPAGEGLVTLTYRPRHIGAYATLTAVGLLGVLVALRGRRG